MPARSWTRRVVPGALAALLVLVGGCTGEPPDRDAQRGAAPARTGALVLPVVPVGGDVPTGRQTRARALAEVDAIAATAAGGIRLNADMRWLCPTRTCDTAPLDPVVERARRHGLRIYLQVNSTPSWMDEQGRWYAPLGADAPRWADLFAQLVARYGAAVAGYEVWNEPNLQEFWSQGPDPAAYADLLRAVWTAVQRVAPDAVLIGGVLSNNDLGYMRRLDEALAERGGTTENGYFYDLLGVHPYAGGEGYGLDPSTDAGAATAETAFGAKDMTFLGMERLRNQVASDEGIARDVFIGEFGYSTDAGAWYSVAEPRRAEYLARALELAQSRTWVRALVPYSYTQGPADGFAIRGTPSEAALQEAADATR